MTAAQSREQKITALAHKIWEDEGRPEGQAEAHWARAVAMLDAEVLAKPATKPATKKAPAKKAPAKKK